MYLLAHSFVAQKSGRKWLSFQIRVLTRQKSRCGWGCVPIGGLCWKISFQMYSGFWHNSVLCGCSTEGSVFLTVSQGLLWVLGNFWHSLCRGSPVLKVNSRISITWNPSHILSLWLEKGPRLFQKLTWLDWAWLDNIPFNLLRSQLTSNLIMEKYPIIYAVSTCTEGEAIK